MYRLPTAGYFFAGVNICGRLLALGLTGRTINPAGQHLQDATSGIQGYTQFMAGIGEKFRFQLASSLGIISCRADFNSVRDFHHKHGPKLDGEKRQVLVQCDNLLNLVV